jgi:antitoxin VapB
MTVPVQIRKEEVVRDIRELAALQRKPITEAVADAVKAELGRARRASDVEARRRDVRRLVEEFNALPRVGPMLTDADLYDEDGLPK